MTGQLFSSSSTEPARDRGRWDRRPAGSGADDVLGGLLSAPGRADRALHVHRVPAREGSTVGWPGWVPAELVDRLRAAGVPAPWAHQAAAAEHAHQGRSVVLSTGTASGKSLAYLLPGLTAALAEDGQARSPRGPRGPSVLYLAPTKALAADQLRRVCRLDLPGLRAATLDGDTPIEARDWVRAHGRYVLTNPDMLHRSLLPAHSRWARLWRSVRYVVVDECHAYRGVFGSHVAHVLRRLQRVCALYGSSPVFVLTSATVSDPGVTAERLLGRQVVALTEDASPRGGTTWALWEPPLTGFRGENGAPVRRTATAECADLLTDLVVSGQRSLAFVRSRRGAEIVAQSARRLLAEVDTELPRRVAAYRGGYLPEERRTLEKALHSGRLLGLATTTALELGVDVSGLDVVLLAGYPGTRASLWQQAGRAGREGQAALAVLVARDDPLDTYLVHHPEALFDQPVEATVLDPDNPHVLAPHLCAAAAESPLTSADLEMFGPTAPDLVAHLERQGVLRARVSGWYWTRRERPVDGIDIRGVGGAPVRIVEAETGRVLGTVDDAAAHTSVHRGAVYVHQGESYLVRSFDLEDAVALVERAEPDYTTFARDRTDIRVLGAERTQSWGRAQLCFGTVEVTRQVVSFLRKRAVTGEVLGEEPLDLPARQLRTKAVWWSLPDQVIDAAGLAPADVPGAAHAAEHASIGLLPLFATCDRWDIGGVSTPLHADTGQMTVFVYDGHAGGAGFADRAHRVAESWLTATLQAIGACECESGCPSCVQSPKCGNANSPLDKVGALRLLGALLRERGRTVERARPR